MLQTRVSLTEVKLQNHQTERRGQFVCLLAHSVKEAFGWGQLEHVMGVLVCTVHFMSPISNVFFLCFAIAIIFSFFSTVLTFLINNHVQTGIMNVIVC